MNYSKLMNQAWELTWRFKSLWILGIFVSASAPYSLNWQEDSKVLSNFGVPLTMSLTLLAVSLVVGFVFMILYFIASGSLIDAVNRLARGGQYRFGNSVANGLHFFWRMLGLGLLVFFVVAVWLGVCAIPAVLCFLMSTVLGVISLFFVVPLGLAGIFAAASLYLLAERSVVVRDIGIGDGIDEAWTLFRRSVGHNVVLALIYLGVTIGFGMLFLVLAAIIAVPFVAMALTSTAGLVIAIAIGIPAVLLLALLVTGVTGAFTNAMYTLFYFDLLDSMQPPAAGAAQVGPVA
jgi:hypothetical protein